MSNRIVANEPQDTDCGNVHDFLESHRSKPLLLCGVKGELLEFTVSGH